jgi:Tol biopolymer transport system component/predicted Ser/Thr protein kinase
MNALAVGSRLGPYEIVALLGTGGMGEVYHAHDTRLDREVALKVLRAATAADADRNDRLVREARLISTLNHPHIRAIYDATEYDGVKVIVMEYVEGEPLSSRLERRPLPLLQVLTYAEQLASALDAAHSQGIIHRDVKPANIMVTTRGVKLLDFGIATLRQTLATTRGSVEASTQTDSGSVPGTTSYMAPEQLDGADDPRSDIFALGVVIYEMLTGRKPFDGTTRARMIAAILEHDPAPLTAAGEPVPSAVERAVMKCLAKDPLERWQTARDLASELAWLARTTESARTPPLSRGGEHRVQWAIASAAVLVGATLAAAYVLSRNPQAAALPAPVRFLAAAPPNAVITVAAGAFSVSPDGRHLAFTASAGGGPRLLWIRSLDSFAARPLSGTDEAGFPFWSPDSRTVGFFAGRQLKTIDISGSPLQIVAEILPAQWGAWGRNGDILFTTPGDFNALYRVRAAGSTPELLLSNESTPKRGVGGPEFLPDGEHFLLGVVEPDKPVDQVSIYVGTFTNPMEQLLVRADSQAVYVEPGYILYSRAGSLVAHPFDPGARRTTGEPISVPEPVGFIRQQRRASFSVSQTNVIAYRQAVPTTQLTWFDRAGRRLDTVGSPARWVNPAIAPDASRLAVTRVAPSVTDSEIWLFEPRGARPLTSSPGMEDYAVWSPDGQRIAYAVSEGGFLERLFMKDAAASAEEPGILVLQNNHNKLPMDWTPDGRGLVFLDSASGSILTRVPMMLSVAPPHASTKELTLQPNPSGSLRSEDQIQLSPDGRWMAYVSDVTGSAQVHVREFPNGQRRWQVSTDGGFEPKWRGDGRELFYIAADQQMMSVAVSDRNGAFEPGRPTPLFRASVLGAPYQNGFVRNEYAVTRDGERFLINEPVDGSPAYAIRVLVNWQSLLPAGSR